MSILDPVREALNRPVIDRAVPPDVQDRLRRGRKWMREDAHKRRLCQLFLDGDAYFYIDNKSQLSSLETRAGVTSGRPKHRIRNRYNFIRPMVDAKVSSSTTRVPGYEINPSSTDPEDVAAAMLAGKIARQGYEKWFLRELRVKAATLAIGGGGSAFALPYFDTKVGPFRGVMGEDGPRMVGEGEIKVLLLNGNEVYWEPGTEFYHSRWYGVETARPIAEVQGLDGFNGAKLEADAQTGDLTRDRPEEGMVLVTMYFERPCPRYPQGRMMTIAGTNQIVPMADYPLKHGGRVIDEPCVHRLSYRLDPGDDRDLGLTWELIDFQRTLNDIYNKCIELKNRALLLRMLVPRGALSGLPAPTDEPGGITEYNPIGGAKPEWENAPDPGILGQLLNIFQRVLDDMRYVAADADVQVAPNVAADAVNQVLQQAAGRWSQFVGDFASWDSKVVRHCLLLAQEHYTEERVLKVRGRFGWEPEAAFRGADIMGQVDVTVNPASIETHSRQAMLAQLAWIQANFPGYVRPEVAIDIAMNGSSPEALIESFEFDKARANEIIQRIRDRTIMDMPSRLEMKPGPMMPGPIDPATGMEGPPVEGPPVMVDVPGWMPREFDDISVQLYVFTTWLKTPDASNLPPEMYEPAMLVYQGLKQIEAQQQAQQMAAQTAQAQELGAGNAAKPVAPKPMPSTPSPNGQA